MLPLSALDVFPTDTMPENRLQRLHDAGQSIWLDFIDRTMLRERRARSAASGDDALIGMTSNPTIFEKALAEGTSTTTRSRPRRRTSRRSSCSSSSRRATSATRATSSRGVYERTEGGDGYVSIEVSPGAANDADATVAEAQRLWATVDRPNVMVKVPGTSEGARAVRAAHRRRASTSTSRCSSPSKRIDRVIEAYMRGARGSRSRAGKPIDRIASVASFFVSRVDTEIDKRLDAIAAAGVGEQTRASPRAHGARRPSRTRSSRTGCSASEFSGDAVGSRSAARGAMVQRPLWASTSTKNPAYRDVMYVEQLIGPDTVNTMPPATIEAFRDHGEVAAHRRRATRASAERTIADARRRRHRHARRHGQAARDGLASFQKSFDSLIAGLERKSAALGRDLASSR